MSDMKRHLSERLERNLDTGQVRRTSSLSNRRGLNNPSLTISSSDPTPALSKLSISTSPDRPSEILPFLYLGDEKHAASLTMLDECKITAILNVAAESERTRFEERFDYAHKVIKDDFEEDIMKHFQECFDFIDAKKDAGQTVLVHCTAGKSRSPTIAMAYLIYSKKWGLKQSYDYVKTKRMQISPNLGFLSMLAEFEKRVLGERNKGLTELCRNSLNELTVLVIEVDGDSRDHTLDLLEELECDCAAAKDAEESIRYLIDNQFDVVLLNATLAGKPGLETALQIRDLEEKGVLENRIPIIIMKSEGEVVADSKEIDGVLQKPVQKEALQQLFKEKLLKTENN